MSKSNPDKEVIDSFQELVKTLSEKLNHEVVKVTGFYQHGVILSFIDNTTIFISAQSSPRDSQVVANKFRLFYDPGMINLSKIVFNQPIKLDYDNGSKWLWQIIKSFTKEDYYNKEKQLKNYHKLHMFELKDLLRKTVHLPVDPNLEFFLYGDDELVARYKNNNKLEIPAKGVRVKIQDKSAILFKGKSRNIDLSTGLFYMNDGYMYLDRNIVEMVDCEEGDHEFVSYNGNNEKKFSKMQLKAGVDLTKIKKIPYELADGMELTLKISKTKNKNGIHTYYFTDDEGKIRISHPDLLIYILSNKITQ